MTLWAFLLLILSLMGFGSVAFITLLERKVLGLSQTRLGPNKVTLFGLAQPAIDGVKLLVKQLILLSKSQLSLFFTSPSVLLGLFILSWVFILPWYGSPIMVKYPSILLFALLGISAYGVMLSGWSVTSSFSKLGAMRSILQSLSFEVALIVTFLFALGSLKSFFFLSNLASVEILFFWAWLWLFISLMENNRAPFDLLEGESELISGFNVEMGSSLFVVLFLSEYGMVVVMAAITTTILAGGIGVSTVLVATVMLFIRSCYPRVRYDSLMGLMWQSVLSLSVVAVVLVVVIY